MLRSNNILIIGKNGQVGWELQRALAVLGPVVAIDYPDINLTDPASIRHWVVETSPSVVVNAAAHTAVDKAEADEELAAKINSAAPGILAEECKKRDALLVHYSTDYVFDGAKSESYTESDAPNPLGAYGRSKLAGDQAIRQVDSDHLIFRLCWVYGARGQNFLRTMMRFARERETLRVVNDQVGSPTWSRMIAEATAMAVKQVLDSRIPKAFKGTYHLSASGQTSWHGFAKAIIDRVSSEGKQCKAITPITTAEYPVAAKRPARSVLCCDKLEKTFGLRLPNWEASLSMVMEEVNSQNAK